MMLILFINVALPNTFPDYFFFFVVLPFQTFVALITLSWYLIHYTFFTGTYIDKKCPFTGDVSIRGRIIAGTCHSAKMVRTIIVRRNYLHWVKKYQRYAALFL